MTDTAIFRIMEETSSIVGKSVGVFGNTKDNFPSDREGLLRVFEGFLKSSYLEPFLL